MGQYVREFIGQFFATSSRDPESSSSSVNDFGGVLFSSGFSNQDEAAIFVSWMSVAEKCKLCLLSLANLEINLK